MNLHEYQAKQLLMQYNIPVPKGNIFNTSNKIKKLILKIGSGPWVVKCQIHAGGRGKAGGIKIAKSQKEIYNFAEQWLGKRLVTDQTDNSGKLVNKIFIEKAVTNIIKEIYLSIIIDRDIHKIIFIASTQGGTEIEKSSNNLDIMHKIELDPLLGPQPYQGKKLAFKLGMNMILANKFSDIFMKLANLFIDLDLTIAEINPLVITNDNNFICLDSKFIVDDNALFRQPKLKEMRDYSQENKNEAHAIQWGLNYICLDGNIGCMVNGAGLAMETMDCIKLYGGKPANFLDIRGNTNKETIIEALKILFSDKKIKTMLINIFGGIVCCDLIADSIIYAISDINTNIPIVIRLAGNNFESGLKKLNNIAPNVTSTENLFDAVQQVIINSW